MDHTVSSEWIQDNVHSFTETLTITLFTGVTTIPFEFPLTSSKSTKQLYDSYHGVFISIQYTLRAELRRGILNKPVIRQLEFIVESEYF